MAFAPAHIGNWRNDKTDRVRIKPGHGTRPVKWSVGGAGNTSALAQLLGSMLRAQAGLVGGSRFHLMQAVNTGAANTLKRWLADKFTTVGASTGAVNISGGNTVTRAVGSFLDDGWSPDDFFIYEYPVQGVVDGNAAGAIISSISADGKTLTFPASTFIAPSTLINGAAFWRGIQQPLSGLAANAGNAAGTPALNVLTDGNPGVDTIVNNSAFYLGAGVALFAALGTALAAGAYVDLTASGGDF